MKNSNIICGRPSGGKVAEGYALVCKNSIMGWNGINPDDGIITEKNHEYEGKSIKDTILVLPGSRGSIGWSDFFYGSHINGCGPRGYVLTKMDSKCGTAIVMAGVPCVSDFNEDNDPCELIKTGDYVKINGETGIVEILERNGKTYHE